MIFLDGSSTALALAELIPSINGITVITNGIDVMSCLSNYDVRAYCTGGSKSKDNGAVLVGDYTERFLKDIRADVAFFSVQSICDNGECFDCYAEEVAVRKVMLQNARRKILLCDSSKRNKPSTFYQCSTKELDYIVCDKDLNDFFKDPTPEKYILAK